MYEQHFGLREQPFALTPNTHFYLNNSSHRQALELLLVALKNREGFLKISGEVGTGKTLLCRMLLNELAENYVTAYIPNPVLSPDALYHAVADELGVEGTVGQGNHQLLKMITEKLVRHASDERQVVLVIDEAQAMAEPTIEALRLLTNLETESAKLLQVVLFGQPELDVMLGRSSLRQLQQRITFQQKLEPLNKQAVQQYVSHRLSAAGYNGPPVFSPGALSLMYRASEGIPRLVNILSHKAMIAAYGLGDREVGRKHIKRAIKDTESVTMPRMAWLYLLPLAPILSAAVKMAEPLL